MRLRGVSAGGRLPARSATGTVTGESWPCAVSAARTSTAGWYAGVGRSRAGNTRRTMCPTSGRRGLRSGGCGVVTSCRLGSGGRVSGSRAGPPSPGRVPVAVAGSRGTSAARECGSTTYQAASRTTRLASIPRRASAGSAPSPRPGQRGGGGHGGDLARVRTLTRAGRPPSPQGCAPPTSRLIRLNTFGSTSWNRASAAIARGCSAEAPGWSGAGVPARRGARPRVVRSGCDPGLWAETV